MAADTAAQPRMPGPARLARSNDRVALGAILIGALVLRLVLADHSLWFDEHASVFFSDQPYARLWSDWMLRETNPPLYYSLLRAWRVLGSSDVTVRALSVLASIAAIAIVHRVTDRIYGRKAALIAALLAALSGQHLYFAEQARAYIFVFCAATIAIGALARFLAESSTPADRRLALLVYAVFATIALYLHTTMFLFPVLATAAIVLVKLPRTSVRPRLPPLLAADLLIAIAAFPAARLAVRQLLYGANNIAPLGLVGPEEIAGRSVQALFLAGSGGLFSLLLGAVCMPLVARFVWKEWQRAETRFLAILTVLSLTIFALLGTIVPIFLIRSIFWISAPLLVLLAAALAHVADHRRRRWLVGGIALAAAIDTVRLIPTLEQEDWNSPVDVVARSPGALLLVHGEAMALLADGTCRRRLSAPCPYSVVAVSDGPERYDTWAVGSWTGPKVLLADLATFVGDRPIFLFRKNYAHDLPRILHAHAMGRGVPADGPPLVGPFPVSALR